MNSSPINIIDSILTCDYLDKNKDYVISLFYDIFMDKKCDINEIRRFNYKMNKYEKILVIRWIISVMLKEKNYDVPILIYLPRMFPDEAPEIFIEKTDEIGVNPKATSVDKSTLRILVPLLTNWNSSNVNIYNVLNQIQLEFHKFFPIFKLDVRERGKYFYGDNCTLNPELIRKVSFEANSQVDSRRPVSRTFDNFNQDKNLNKNVINPKNAYDPNVFNQIEFFPKPAVNSIVYHSEEQIKKILINELASTMVPKIKMEFNKLKNDEQKMLTYQEEFSQQIEQVRTLAEKKDEILSRIKNLSSGIQDQIVMIKYYLEANSRKDMNSDKVDNFIKISNPNKLKIIISEAVIEDYLFYIKKGYEKKVFNFSETIKLIRQHSRELFFIKYMKERNIDK